MYWRTLTPDAKNALFPFQSYLCHSVQPQMQVKLRVCQWTHPRAYLGIQEPVISEAVKHKIKTRHLNMTHDLVRMSALENVFHFDLWSVWFTFVSSKSFIWNFFPFVETNTGDSVHLRLHWFRETASWFGKMIFFFPSNLTLP